MIGVGLRESRTEDFLEFNNVCHIKLSHKPRTMAFRLTWCLAFVALLTCYSFEVYAHAGDHEGVINTAKDTVLSIFVCIL